MNFTWQQHNVVIYVCRANITRATNRMTKLLEATTGNGALFLRTFEKFK